MRACIHLCQITARTEEASPLECTDRDTMGGASPMGCRDRDPIGGARGLRRQSVPRQGAKLVLFGKSLRVSSSFSVSEKL